MQFYILKSPSGGGGILSRPAVAEALRLHAEVEAVSVSGENLRSLCVEVGGAPGAEHPCLVTGVLSAFGWDAANLPATDAEVLTAINSKFTVTELQQLLGDVTLSTDGTSVT